MVSSSSQHNDALHAFHQWRVSAEARLPGIGGPELETECPFIPRSNLKEYFERPHQLENLLDAVLDDRERPAVDPNYVREHYSQSFATLLCTGQPRMIHHFQQYDSLQDQKLPHRTRPDDFPLTISDEFEAFRREQYQFCAPKLEYSMNKIFKEEDILPIIQKEEIGEGGSAIIYKIVVDENYNSLRPHGHVIPKKRQQYKNTFVLKTYRDAEAKENYKAERDAYMRLKWSGKPSSHIIAYYGGFIHGNSYNIILEYADQGTLEDFMRRTMSPSTIEDNLLMWDRLFNVTHGMMTIHGNIGRDNSASQILSGIHQDIKPANILAFSGEGPSPYDVHFKIADLGLIHFKPSVSHPKEPFDLDAFGTRAYGAPENYRSHIDADSTPIPVTPAVDIWSIGCIFSEVSVWAHYGFNRVVEYRRQRSVEIESRGGGQGEHIFHFDGDLLDAVKNTHQDIKRKISAKDLITRLVLERLVDEMLQHGPRLYAALLHDRSKRLVKDCEGKYGISVDAHVGNTNGEAVESMEIRTRNSQHVPHHHHHHHRSHSGRRSPLQEPRPPDDDFTPSPSTSRSQSSSHRHHHKSESHCSNRRSAGAGESSQPTGQSSRNLPNPPLSSPKPLNNHEKSPDPPAQQHQEWPIRPTLTIEEGERWKKGKKDGSLVVLRGNENLTTLNERDHIFLVDNSSSMKQYTTEVERVVSLLGYMLKKSDKDGIDMFFTQTVTKVNSETSSKLLKSIRQEPFAGNPTDMRARLQSILQGHINRFGTWIQPPKPIVGRQPPSYPQRPLSFYILTDAKWQPTDVEGLIKDLVQKMRAKGCPKEHVGIQFIRFGNEQASIAKLDKLDHGLGLKDIGMDIVDHTYWNGNVWKILLGALNDWYDDDPP